MSAFQPLSVSAIPASSIPSSDTEEYTQFITHYVQQAFQLVRSSASWKRGKAYTSPDGGHVQTICGPSGMSGKLAKLNWQMRQSEHSHADFDDFRNRLLLEHAPNEQRYIPSLIEVKQVQVVKKDEAVIWRNSYKLPIVTADRDFLELIITLDLPHHPEPYGEAHEQATVAKLQGKETGESEVGYRSFMVLQLPVTHHQEPERKDLVRAYYASVEAVCQRQEVVEWKMMVQSDSAGKIPVFLQEMSMPGKIAEDVPLFIEWVHSKEPSS